MACPIYPPGSTPTFAVTFVDPDGEPCTPTTVTATLLLPDATTAAANVTPDGDGFLVDAPVVTLPGVYWLQVEGAGAACDGLDESTMFRVVESRFP